MNSKSLLSFTSKGIFCAQAGVYIDPQQPVDKAIVTHAHSDHARWGSKHYVAQHLNQHILKLRLGEDISLETKDWGERFQINGVNFSFHPAGHIWGSAQVRVEYKGEIWCVTGDYKIEDDGFSQPFELVKCHAFVTECTFGLPVFNWDPQAQVMRQINDWWRGNAEEGKTSILVAYALGKAQRLIKNIDLGIGEVFVQGAVDNVNKALEASGAILPRTTYVSPEIDQSRYKGALVVTPGSSVGTSWMRKFQPYEVATVSGWMAIRGIKRRRNAGQGFVMSDHADWNGLNQAVAETGAERVYAMHGYTDVFARWLNQNGLEAYSVDELAVRDEEET